jgi:hypothetical protein
LLTISSGIYDALNEAEMYEGDLISLQAKIYNLKNSKNVFDKNLVDYYAACAEGLAKAVEIITRLA